ncbi:Glycine betaine-binding protein OpuAC [Lentibacillus sp. JNUCC-1]|uniref:glycine betaine ABC transporter substrate-binding protein n=1 Tax=Lentibacillus sp. JNUCC-1 TaxID=2654513 RepID=UPI0012E824A0|nr:glycine betaine ABC transporter substrate-binding protein [Lentibacillus sp. JNUCC-1]MUV37797.1 Glycine betaine-binding protein OpuAC [Lentibacillus sp. JNUCC-1]
MEKDIAVQTYKGVIPITFKVKRKSIIQLAIALATIFVIAGCGNNDNADEKSTDQNASNDTSNEKTSITVGLDPYDYSTVPAYLSQVILEQEGYDVEIQEAEVGILYQALANKDIDAYVDVSRPKLHESYIEKYDDQFVTAGTLISDLPLGVAVPKYLEDINSIEDVIENAEMFDNKIYAIEPGSGMGETTVAMVEDYGMDDFEISNSSTAAMLAQVKRATDKEEPIVFNAWRPNPMFVYYDIKFLDDPKGTWNHDDVEVGVIPEFEEESPTAYTLFSNMSLDLDMIEEWIIGINDEDKKPRKLAEEWVENNPDVVDKWLEKQ